MNPGMVVPTPSTPSTPEPTQDRVRRGEPLSRAAHRGPLARAAGESLYLLVSWPLSLAGFVASIVLVAVGAATLVLVVGFPILVAGLAVARGMAAAEVALQRVLLGRDVVEALPTPRTRGNALERLVAAARHPQRLADVLFSLVGWIFSTFTWSLTLTLWAMVLAGLTSPLWSTRLPAGAEHTSAADLVGLGHLPGADVVADVLLGLAALVVLPLVTRALATAQSGLNAWLLVAPTRSARLEREHRGRLEATHTAEARSLAQLERDIHDGPQQRLVRLQIDLARASRQWERDPAAARAAIDAATLQAQDALDELRAATRGVAPPILVDRGLVAALDELAGRSAVPTTLRCDLPRLNPGYETALYFGVTEALTNAAKHARATRADVHCFVDGPWAVAEVRDDGVGGAHLGKGTGLAGLERRLAGLGGSLTLDSPTGGPTLVRLEVPCVS